MPNWRRFDHDPASDRQRDVYGVRVGGNRHRTSGRLQPRRGALDASPSRRRSGVRRCLWPAFALGKVVAVDDVRASFANPGGLFRTEFRVALADDVCENEMKPLSECRLYGFVDSAY